MEGVNKNARLFVDGLAQLQPLVQKVESFEEAYETSRQKVLSEDLFWSEDKDEVYRALREHDTTSSDLIKGLKKELQELMALAATVELGDTNKEDK